MPEVLHKALHGFLDLFYPRFCPVCDTPLKVAEDHICLACYHTLPQTDYHKMRNNPMEKTFYGRLPLEKAAAFMTFTKGGKAQKLIHAVKYKGNWEVGRYLGFQFGMRMLESGFCEDMDALIPVPLHPKKEKKRGYNQAEAFGKGISEATGLPMLTDVVKRRTASDTQTRKGRYDRWLNVNQIFSFNQAYALSDQHLLLFDDVLTTGATLEAMGHTIRSQADVKMSAATIGLAASLA